MVFLPFQTFTFGSFNNLSKITPRVARVWSEILGRLPGSVLFIKARFLSDPGTREYLTEMFRSAGTAPERLVLSGPVETHAGHLDTYQGIDIALDTFPYNGTTTTCEALWMGVPVITLEGRTHVSRVGTSILTHAGLPELVAGSEEEYVGKALDLARDEERLAAMHRELRGMIRNSPMMDAGEFTRGLEAEYRKMWIAWCRDRGQALSQASGAQAPAGDAAALVSRGEELFTAGDIDKAMEAFLKALEIDPANTTALNDLGVACWTAGDTDRAVHYFNRTLAIDSSNPDSLANLEEIERVLAGKGNP